MWLVLSIILLSLIIFHIIIPRKFMWPSVVKKINKIPGPPALPYFGNSLSFIVSNDEFLPLLLKFSNQYKPIWKITMLGTPFVFMSDLDDIKVILKSRTHIKKGIDYDLLLPWLGTGLLISSGKKWFDHRKWLTPAFHFSILEQYINIMNKSAQILCNILKTQGKQVEINPLVTFCTLDIICETAMGTQVNAQQDGEKEYVKSIIRMGQIFTERTLSPWLYRDFIFNLSPIGKEHNKIIKIVHGFTEKVIRERQQKYKEKTKLKNTTAKEKLDFEEKKRISFLDLLIEISETQQKLTEEEIREEVDTFMFEGHDTTAAAINWALFELGLNSKIQDECYKEQTNIFETSERQPNISDLQEMKYLERVIKETLRLYPSVPIISRELEEEVKIKDYCLPVGTQIPIFIYNLHRNPDVFPEPNKFDPDRFLTESMGDIHPYSYIPFSAGPRNCIGQKFAIMEEKVILSHLLRKFKFTTLNNREDVKMIGELILRPQQNFKMLVEPR